MHFLRKQPFLGRVCYRQYLGVQLLRAYLLTQRAVSKQLGASVCPADPSTKSTYLPLSAVQNSTIGDPIPWSRTKGLQCRVTQELYLCKNNLGQFFVQLTRQQPPVLFSIALCRGSMSRPCTLIKLIFRLKGVTRCCHQQFRSCNPG